MGAIDGHGDWIECWQCDGNGNIAGCFEDTCSCTGDPEDPDDCCAPSRCDVCRGKGGWNEGQRAAESLFVECRYFEHSGEVLVYLKFANGEGAFAYDTQVENGTIKPECFLEPGYAHVTKNGAVFRHNEMIGTLADFLPETKDSSRG